MPKFMIPEPPQFLEAAEVKRIIEFVSQTSKDKYRYRNVLILETMWESGGRISEVLALTPEAIGDNSLILVNLKQHREFAHKEVVISPDLCRELRLYAKGLPQGAFVFPANRPTSKRVTLYRYMYGVIKDAAEALGIRKMKKYIDGPFGFSPAWPHLFRHASAMHILDQTGDLKLVQRQLGHSSVVTTEMYAQIRPEKAKKGLTEVNW